MILDNGSLKWRWYLWKLEWFCWHITITFPSSAED